MAWLELGTRGVSFFPFVFEFRFQTSYDVGQSFPVLHFPFGSSMQRTREVCWFVENAVVILEPKDFFQQWPSLWKPVNDFGQQDSTNSRKLLSRNNASLRLEMLPDVQGDLIRLECFVSQHPFAAE